MRWAEEVGRGPTQQVLAVPVMIESRGCHWRVKTGECQDQVMAAG